MTSEGTLLQHSMRRHRRELMSGVIAGAGLSLSAVGLAATSAWLLVRASQRPSVLSLTVAMGSVQLFALARSVFRYLERTLTHRAGLRIMAELRSRVARSLTPLLPYGVGPRRSEVVEALLGDVESAQAFLTATLSPLVTAAVATAAASIIVAVVDGIFAGVISLLTLVGLGLALPVARARVAQDLDRRVRESESRIRTLCSEVLTDRDGAACAGRRVALARDLASYEAQLDRALTQRSWRLGALSALHLLAGAALVVWLARVGVVRVADHGMALALVGVGALSVLASLDLIAGTTNALRDFAEQRARLEHLESIVRLELPVREPQDLRDDDAAHRVEVSAQSLHVELGNRDVITNASFELVPGTLTWLRGPSGSGKTTLLSLVAKFRDGHGALRLEGVDYRFLSSPGVRHSVGLVDDAPHIFATTLRANLTLARDDASDELLRLALSQAQLSDFLATLPQGLDTELGGAHQLVSGGEARRIGLAREFLSARPIVLLDEPTEGLDEPTAEALIHSLRTTMPEACIVISSHRDLSAVADQILDTPL